MACVAISPDDQWIVAGSDENYLQVWSIVSGDAVLLIEEDHSGYSRHACVAVTHDSTRIVSSSLNDLLVCCMCPSLCRILSVLCPVFFGIACSF